MPTTQPNPGGVVTSPSDIERELRRIWREAAKLDAQQDSEIQPRIRAVLANIFFIVSPQVTTAELDRTIESLLLTYPSRFFIFRRNESAELETRVSSRCVMTPSGSHVCSEEIYIAASSKGEELVSNLLLSLLVADVGVKAVILGDPSVSEVSSILSKVSPLIDLVIYDSLACADCREVTARFLELRQASHDDSHGDKRDRKMRMRDLNWYRLARWRTLIAEQFNKQSFRPMVDSIRRIQMTSSKFGGVPPGESMLLAGWISACLKHAGPFKQLRDHNRFVALSEKSEGSLELSFDETESNYPPGMLTRLEIVFGTGVSMVFEMAEKESVLHVKVNGQNAAGYEGDFSDRQVSFPVLPPERLLGEPLNSSGIDDYFTRSLEYSFRIFGES